MRPTLLHPHEATPLQREEDDMSLYSNEDEEGDPDEDVLRSLRPEVRSEIRAADRLSTRLLSVQNDDSDEEDRILRHSLRLLDPSMTRAKSLSDMSAKRSMYAGATTLSTRRAASRSSMSLLILEEDDTDTEKTAKRRVWVMVLMAMLLVVVTGLGLYFLTSQVIGPPNQPVGPYRLTQLQEGESLFSAYTFYDGADSVGSNGYNRYVSLQRGESLGIVNVTMEPETVYRHVNHTAEKVPFVYIKSAPTDAGPRESIRLEGNRRYNRGLFIIDLRHMPTGCGVWYVPFSKSS
jgi:hypothetical protein